MAIIAAQDAQDWLIDKVAHRLGVDRGKVPPEQYFDELDLDSTEALILAGEMENWLGFELGTTALWYHPTIKDLAEHIAQVSAERADAA
ncbi:acyl carrier protein [Streptomyces sp. PT12]|uniref:acyl carrier protein n=1 Tax=Streptomyces sp. PT12 TaxID=1510197 RepID=UPI000DE42A87|nr:acyl carrier protein [Streptomyces sp. PT12]RBM20687.1 polyketide synthase [Streptomyces sp. PT12]